MRSLNTNARAAVLAFVVATSAPPALAQDDTHETLRAAIDELVSTDAELRQSVESMRSEQREAMDDLKSALAEERRKSERRVSLLLRVVAVLRVQVYVLAGASAVAIIVLAIWVIRRKSACLRQTKELVAAGIADALDKSSLRDVLAQLPAPEDPDELQATTTEGDSTVAERFNDLEVRDKFKHGSVNYVVRARGNGKYMIRIRGRNTRSVLLESDNDYDRVEEAEEILALIHDETVKGNVARVHKPAEDAEDDVRD